MPVSNYVRDSYKFTEGSRYAKFTEIGLSNKSSIINFSDTNIHEKYKVSVLILYICAFP